METSSPHHQFQAAWYQPRAHFLAAHVCGSVASVPRHRDTFFEFVNLECLASGVEAVRDPARRDISNGVVVAGDVLVILKETFVQYVSKSAPEQVTFQRVLVFIAERKLVEMPELTKHGADVGSLEKQPLHDTLLFSDGIAAQLAGLLGQIQQYRATLHQQYLLALRATRVAERRDFAVRAQAQIGVVVKLVIVADIDQVCVVVQFEFFQRDTHFLSVGCCKRVELQVGGIGGWPPFWKPCHRWVSWFCLSVHRSMILGPRKQRSVRMSQVVVVSGGAGGIGGATVARFVEGGARVVFTDWDEARGAEQAASFADADNAPVFVPADVRDEAACANVAATAVREFGRIDVLVNNAAVRNYQTVVEADMESWRRVLDVNLMGYVNMAKAAIVWMSGAGAGNIVNVASIRSVIAGSKTVQYDTTKAAILGLTRSMARDHAACRGRTRANLCIFHAGRARTGADR